MECLSLVTCASINLRKWEGVDVRDEVQNIDNKFFANMIRKKYIFLQISAQMYFVCNLAYM